MGSHEFSSASGSPLYAGPDPDRAPGCEADNNLGLGVDTAPYTKTEGCCLYDMKNLALDGPSWRHDTKMDAKVKQRGRVSARFRATDGRSRMMKTTR